MTGNTSKIASGSSSEHMDGPECLLKHANEVRKHANLDTLDAYLSQSGYSWIEMMISHAKDSYEGYQQSSFRSNSANGQAFEHHMAAELLKTPSPTKKRTAALRHKLPSARPKTHSNQINDPFSEEANKENHTASPSSAVKSLNEKDNHDKDDSSKEAQRNTRSKSDKSHLVQLPNPFLSKSSNTAASEQSKHPKQEHQVTTKNDKEPKKTVASQAKSKAKSKKLPDQAVEEKQEETKDISTKNVEQTKPEEKTSLAHKVNAVPKVTEPIDFVDDSQEVEYSLQVAPHEDLATTRITSISERIQPLQPKQMDERSLDPIDRKIVPEPEEDVERSDDEYEIKRPVQRESESPSPRESTPPPLSPTKAQRAQHTVKAREKLEESLLKLASDAEDSNEEEESISEVVMKGTLNHLKSSKSSNGQTSSKINQQQPEPTEGDAGDESTVEEGAILEQQKVETTAAPKRTLSSIAHAKKSIVGSSSGVRQQGRDSSMAPSAGAGGAKISFLSKSIMKAEQDQKSLDDSLELIAPIASSVSPSAEDKKLASKKRKSDEAEIGFAEDLPLSKSKRTDENDDSELQKSKKAKEMTSKHAPEEQKSKSTTAGQAQSFRQKIESFNTNKNSNASSNVPTSQSNPSRTFSSMSTHSVGIGATKISSPIFSRSNSQNTIAPEPLSPSRDVAKAKENVEKSPEAARSKDRGITEKSKQTESTTPLNSPGPSALSLYPTLSELQKKQKSPSKFASPVRNTKQVSAEEKEMADDLSDSDIGGYDTSTDGDLSLVDLVGSVQTNTTVKSSATAPRPPGTSLRPISALPKTNGKAPPSAQKATAFMPSSTANGKTSRPVSRLGKPIEDQSVSSAVSTASSNTATSTATSSSMGNSIHATWGGSISSKLKGILGFSSTSPGKNVVTTPHTSASTSTKPSSINGKQAAAPVNIPARKESFISSNQGNTGSRLGTTTIQNTTSLTEKKSATAIRADLVKKKEAEQAEKKSKEKEERIKAAAAVTAAAESAKKRTRDEQQAQQATKSKPASVGPAAGKAYSSQQGQSSVQRPANIANQADAKKRKSNEGVAVSAKMSTVTKQTSSQALKVKSTATSATASTSSQINKAATAKIVQSNPSTNVFSDHNPFQRAQTSQQQQALAAVSQQMQMHKAKNVANVGQNIQMLSPNSKIKAAATAHIELEEPDSAYSDSEDEETIRKRLQHKPWETREGLASALEAQAEIDADLIFGIPQGAVPLDDILPAQSEHARVRRMRPRSSSATWSRDGLKQFEIDRYNERMGIKGPGAMLSNNIVGSGISRDDGSGTPNKTSRMSALAQSAIAQGQTSTKKQRQ